MVKWRKTASCFLTGTHVIIWNKTQLLLRRRQSSDTLDTYILSRVRQSQGLEDGVTRQTASRWTYFHVKDTPRDWQMTSLFRQSRHVILIRVWHSQGLADGVTLQTALKCNTYTCKTLPGTGRWRHSSDSLDMYLFIRVKTLPVTGRWRH